MQFESALKSRSRLHPRANFKIKIDQVDQVRTVTQRAASEIIAMADSEMLDLSLDQIIARGAGRGGRGGRRSFRGGGGRGLFRGSGGSAAKPGGSGTPPPR